MSGVYQIGYGLYCPRLGAEVESFHLPSIPTPGLNSKDNCPLFPLLVSNMLESCQSDSVSRIIVFI